MIFRCMGCPWSYCDECLPAEVCISLPARLFYFLLLTAAAWRSLRVEYDIERSSLSASGRLRPFNSTDHVGVCVCVRSIFRSG